MELSKSFSMRESSRMSEIYTKHKPENKGNYSEQELSKRLCKLAVEVIGKDQFRNWEGATNFVCINTKFNSDRFYNIVANSNNTETLEDFEIDIIEFILENGGTDGYLDYYYKHYNDNVRDLSSVIEEILKFGEIGYCPWNDSIDFYQFKDFIRSLDLGYFKIGQENDNCYFTIYVRPQVGVILEKSNGSFFHKVDKSGQLGIHVGKNCFKVTGCGIKENDSWSLEDFKVFSNKDIDAIYYHLSGLN